MAEIKVGDYVKHISGAFVRGKVVDETITRTLKIEDSDGHVYNIPEKHLELTPKLTTEEAWERLPILIIEQVESLKSHQSYYNGYVLFASDRSDIRHECYKLLGGAGIKVEPIKGRVTSMVEDVARAMGVRVL